MRDLAPLSANALFIPDDGDPNALSSVRLYTRWLDSTGRFWMNADLSDYVAWLRYGYRTGAGKPLKASSIQKHVQRVRSRYNALLNSNALRDYLQAAYDNNPDARQEFSRYEFTQETLIRIGNNVNGKLDNMPTVTDTRMKADSDHKWMSTDEVHQLIKIARSPGNLLGHRDALLIALGYAFGMRESEIISTTVENLNETFQGYPAVRIIGKGNKQRLVHYLPETADFLEYVHDWQHHTGIRSGVLACAITRDGKRIRHKGITRRALIARFEALTDNRPHDLRRSYAKTLYDTGMYDLEYIQQQLGHEDVKTTMIYVGLISGQRKRKG